MTERRHDGGHEAKLRFLGDPATYGEGPVEVRETHMSWVFLTPRRVFKLKKPVRHDYLDFSTVEKRRFTCEEELRLNRRLAADTYLRTLPLRQDDGGALSLGGPGSTVDWLVEMKRLPQSEMLDERLRSGHVSRGEIAAVANRLAEFYRDRRPEIADGGAYLAHLEEEQRINRTILLRPEFDLTDPVAGLLDRLDEWLARVRPEILGRIADGEIVEGHGDLRPEHVCLLEPPQIIDCLEFNRAMRLIDPYDEVNYLGMECEMLGNQWIRGMLDATLDRVFDRRPTARLLAVYGGFRALLRARLCVAHLLEASVRLEDVWRPLALRYLAQAEREMVSLPSPGGPK